MKDRGCPGQTSPNLKMNARYLRAEEIEMAVTSSVARDYLAWDCCASESLPREPGSFAHRCTGRAGLVGFSASARRRPWRAHPSHQHSNMRLVVELVNGRRPRGKAVFTQMPLSDVHGSVAVHVYRVRLLHELHPSAGTGLISRKSEQARGIRQHTPWVRISCVQPFAI